MRHSEETDNVFPHAYRFEDGMLHPGEAPGLGVVDIDEKLAAQYPYDGSFDREFWRRIPPQERLELVWAMALEAGHWRGERGGQPRLQRSVCRVERRGR